MNVTTSSPALPTVRRRSFETTLAIVAALAIAVVFWTQQRYPSLTKKMHAGTAIQVKGAISYDALMSVSSQMPVAERIGRTSVNWLWTNRYGMYFALPFGAVMMTIFSSGLRARRLSSSAGNVLCGAVAGAPLGVCTNCATPIGQGLLAGGASTRMTVAAMISSPSFNPVVLAMSFLLFPLPLAWARVLVPALLLVLLPVLVEEKDPPLRTISMGDEPRAALQQLGSFLVSFAKNLLRLVVLTLPWMILAAVLGALLAEAVPAYGTHIPVSALGVIFVAILGTLLPVPMSFDVGLAYVLYRSGVPVPYVTALLCTLGPLSIYSLSALGKQIGRSTALRLGGALAAMGCIVGWAAML